MKNQTDLIISRPDFERISALAVTAKRELADLLEEELARARIVAEEERPADVVAMNSTVAFEDMDTGKTSVITLVYPPEADIDANKVSILTPVGSALIGLRVGQIIHWPLPNGREKKLKVVSVRAPA